LSELSKIRLENELAKLGISRQLYVFKKVDSTNRWLVDNLTADSSAMVCVANEQTAGSGRSGRDWYSPPVGNIYFSYSVTLAPDVQDFSPLSLVIGLVVLRVLTMIGVTDVALKWPNDILRNNKKLAGILIEVKTIGRERIMVIGIGINVFMPANSEGSQWADIADTGLGVDDRERIIALILAESESVLPVFFEYGFERFKSEWNTADAWAGELVQILDHGNAVVSGIESGVDESGRLMVLSDTRLLKIHTGDLSLRKNHD